MKLPLERNLDYCLKCSICQTQCPVLKNKIDFPGPKHLGPELERLRLAKGKEYASSIDESLVYCTNCKKCDLACPHGVKPSYYNLKNKAHTKGSLILKIRNWILAHNAWWGKIGSRIPNLTNLLLKNPLTRLIMGYMGVAPRNLPPYKKQYLQITAQQKEKKALYFPGCYASFNEPQIIQAAVDILQIYGYQVKVAAAKCCGTPMFSNGFLKKSSLLAAKNIDLLSKYIEEGYQIITTCPSCGLTLKEEYQHLLPGKESTIIAQSVWDIFEIINNGDLLQPDLLKNKIEKAYYHVPCHLQAQLMARPAVQILRRIAVKELVVEDSYCCGIAGTFGFKKENYELSVEIGNPLFNDINQQKPSLVITDCGTCKLQISQNTSVEVTHPLLIIHEMLNKAN